MSFKEFRKELNGDRVEGELLRTMLYSLLTSFIVLSLLYYFKLQYLPDFIPKYGYFLFFSVLSYALIIPAMRQVRAYGGFQCMSGMMIGMTIGMIAGFLPGFFVGGTNGMFYGSLVGMSIGIIFGIWNGLCCGVMGFMEGTMAGFMGGLMGAMTAVMMLNDNLKIAGVIVFTVSTIIMIGLNYMIFQEAKERNRESKEDHMFTILVSFILTSFTAWMMVFGPRSFLFQ